MESHECSLESVAAAKDAVRKLVFFLELKEERPLELRRQSVKKFSHRLQVEAPEDQLGSLAVFLPKLEERLPVKARLFLAQPKQQLTFTSFTRHVEDGYNVCIS